MKTPFEYNVIIATAGTLNDRKSNSFTVQAGKDFYFIKGMYSTDNTAIEAGTDATYGGGLVEIQYSAGGNQNMQNQAVPVAHLFGQKGLGYGPLVMPAPQLFPGASTITVTVTTLIASAISWRFSFIGIHTDAGEGLRA